MAENTKAARAAMPLVTACIDDLRTAFGRPEIDEQIRGGMRGLPTFWARENGQEIGTRSTERGPSFDGTHLVLQIPIGKESNAPRR